MEEEFTIRISKQKAVDAYLEELSGDRGNGHYKIDVARGLFTFYRTEKQNVEPHFAQAGNYYPPQNKIDEFSIRCYFDEDEIFRHDSDIGHVEPEDDISELVDIWKEIVGSAVLDHVTAEDGTVYKIEWT